MELGSGLHGFHHVGSDGIDELQGAVSECVVNRGIVRAEHEVDLGQGYLVCCPVVGVGFIGHGLVVLPLGQHHRTAGYETCFQCPCAGVGVSAFRSFHTLLGNGIECRECAQIQEVCARSVQLNSEGLAVFGSFDVQGAVVLGSDDACQVGVVSAGGRISHSLPAVSHVLSIQYFAVGPKQAVLHGEGIGHAVFAHLIAFCQFGNQLAVLIVSVQAGEGKDCQACAVYGGV